MSMKKLIVVATHSSETNNARYSMENSLQCLF